MTTTPAGTQCAEVTFVDDTVIPAPDFIDMYLEQGGTTYNPSVEGETGFMDLTAARTAQTAGSVMVHIDNRPIDIETELALNVFRSGEEPPPPPPEQPQPQQQAQARAQLVSTVRVDAVVEMDPDLAQE